MAVRRDYGPAGACQQKAVALLLLLVGVPFLLVRLVVRKAGRR